MLMVSFEDYCELSLTVLGNIPFPQGGNFYRVGRSRTVDLQHFVRQAEEFHAKDSDYDVVKEYLQLSGNCHELGQYVKELATCDSSQAMALLNAMCHILIRLASDLPVFIAAGTSIVNEMLSYGMKTIFNFLKRKQKSTRTKSALHLLTAMIALGNQTAHQVVAKLNFSNPEYLCLLNRTNFSEDEDVRTAYLNLIVLVITVCNNNIIRQIVEVKGFLNSIFPGLISDRVSTITLILNTFRRFIIENVNIPKTAKLHLFNDHSLKPVIQLYTWKGPVRVKKHGKRKLGEEKYSVAYDVSDEELAEVRSCTHEFMLALCCSHKNGIIFSDLSCGVSGRNHNIVITNILKNFSKPFMDPLMSSFVISVIQACPDQLKQYLTIFKDSFVPRLSTSWLNVVDFLEKILKSQNIVTVLFKTEVKRSATVLVSIAKTFCLLDVLIASDLSEVFNSGHRVLCYHLNRFLLSILTQIEAVVKFCDHPDTANIPYDASELSNFKLLFLSLMFPCFPAVDRLQKYWHKITYEKSEILQDEAVKDLPIPTFSEELSTLIEVIKFYKTFSSELNREFDFDLPQMLNGLKICNSVLSSCDLSKVYSTVIDFCSKENSISLWNKQKVVDSPLALIRDIYLEAHKSKELSGVRDILHKILLCTNVFVGCQWEIDLWLEALESAKSRHIPIIFDFINETIHLLLKQNNHIEDQEMADVIDIKKNEKSDNINESSATEDTEILYIPSDQKSFSNFVIGAFQTLQSLREEKTKGCQMFMEKALDPLMHYQHSPKNLFTAIQQYKSMITPYLYEYWKFLSSSIEIKVYFENLCLGNSSCTLDINDHLRQNFFSTHLSSVKLSSCNLNNMCESLNGKSIQRTVWQLLAYIDFEVKFILKRKSENCALMTYIQLLKQLMSCLLVSNNDVMDTSCNEEYIKVENSHIIPTELVLEMFKDFLSHPTILKLFLFDLKIVENKSEHLNNSAILATKLVLDVVQNVLTLGNQMLSSFLTPFKKKVLKYLYKGKKSEIESNIERASIIGTFSPLFGTSDVQVLLENLLAVENNAIIDLDSYFSSLCLLMQTFIEKEETIILSSDSINGLMSKFVSLPKKKRKILRQYLLNLLQKHPIYGLLVTEDTALLLLQHKSSKDLTILGTLIDYNDKFRKVTQTFISDKFDESDSTEYMYLASRCLCNCSKDEQDSDFKDLIASNFFSSFEELVFGDISADLDTLYECGIGKAMQLLFLQKHSNPKKLQDFCKLILKNQENEMPSPSKMLIILQVFELWKFYSHETNKIKLQILKVCCLWLSSGLSESFKCPELFNFIKELLQSMNDFGVSKYVDVTDFFSKCLKFALKCADIGKDLLKILSLLCEKSTENSLPVQSLHGLLTGHSQFFKVMLSDEGVKNSPKENLIDLLIILTKLDGTVCKENHIGLLLSAYGASMSSVDQKLLYLMKLYADNNINMSQYSPFLWGKSAISHYSIMKTSQSYLWKQPKLQDILSLLLPEKIENTLLYFPIHMKLEPSPELIELEDHLANRIYDMRFFLPLFAHLLSPGAFVHCSHFIHSKAPLLIFISLSSLEPLVRALSFYCLSQFYQHLEGAYYKEKGIWLCLIDSLRNSIPSTNPKIPNIVSLFLARATDIFTKPEHKLYRPLYTFILRKPLLDIGQVPEFYNLFNSSYVEHRILRHWLLNLLGDGLRSSLDFHICEKRYIFSSLLTHYVSCLSTNQEKIAILQSLNSAVKIKSSAHTLCQRGLLIWLQKVIEESDLSEVFVLKCLCEIMKNLEVNVPDYFNYTLVLWSFIRKIKFLDINVIKTLLSSLLQSLTSMKNSDKSFWSGYKVSLEEIDQLYELWKSLTERFQSKEKYISEEKVSVELANAKECSLLCSKIVTFWEPLLEANTPELLYKKQMKSLTNVLELMLKKNDKSSFYSSELPIWLLKCAVADKKHELVKLFISSERNEILSLVIQVFETCLKEEQELKLTKTCSCDDWKKFLLYLKDVSMSSNITSTSPILQQIADAVQ
ncbi:Nucleolar pre-ribosomal-associated protein 1 [Araneus ventricosus]|uniref:Nucleolar pre-ribosomal-associated protein 1 n=1 Tax=Araneus ventricosus TaxID=182803 RepID=A0A4Y2E9I3_ARAVE|nr:Nucleolar pre-ribosomal-associated protein 1 [Araneus ventricosus]